MSTVIGVRNLSYAYDGKTVIEDLSFDVQARDFVGLIGSNGAGKTTLLKTLVGLLKPTSGELTLFGKPIREFDEWHRIGYVPQKNALNPLFPATVREVVLSGLYGKRKLYRRVTAQDRQRCDDALYAMQIADLAERRIGQLSGGQQQRAFLARALVGNPELLVLDEPTNGLDPPQIREMREVLKRYAATGRTVVVSSHLLAEVSQTVDHVVIMDRGRLVTSASLAELTTQPDVVVRSPEAERLRSELSHLGIDVTAADDVVTASGTTPEQVGRVIGRLGLVVYEMRLEQADLEDVFFSLTAASEGAMT